MLRMVAVSNTALLLITATEGIPEAMKALLSGAKTVKFEVLSPNVDTRPALAIAALKILKLGSLLIRVFRLEPVPATGAGRVPPALSNSLLHACSPVINTTAHKNNFVPYFNVIKRFFKVNKRV